MTQAAQSRGGADDDLQIVLTRGGDTAVEDPLSETVEQNDMRERADGEIVPEMGAGDRRGLQLSKVSKAGVSGDGFFGEQFQEPIERDGADIPVSLETFAGAQLYFGDAISLENQPAHRVVEGKSDAMLGKPLIELTTIQFPEGDARNLDLKAPRMSKEGIDKDLASILEANVLRFFVERTDEDNPPEALHGSRGLALMS